ncbi:soluble quino protein glucose dehydrogenase [Thozetella sp. PMI_491]|nr:soluble quino protein glucose dehydrogenase [Thozetella sp. PMI_491]
MTMSPKMAPGYNVSLLATGLNGPRAMVFDKAGNLLVAEQGSGRVILLTLGEQGNRVCPTSSKVLISAAVTNHGIALSVDGKTLFVSNMSTVMAFPYSTTGRTVGAGKAIITGISTKDGHVTRELLVSNNTLLVAVGSAGNIDASTVSKESGRSMIKMFSISNILAKPVNYLSAGQILGWGLRNIVGIGEDPIYHGVWSVENSMDNIFLAGRDVHNSNPADKMNYHGVLHDAKNPMLGKNYGYPSCVAAWDTVLLQNASMNVGTLFSPDGVPPIKDCSVRQQARIHFAAHTAPLDIKFLPNGSAAYVSLHGSWDRSPPDGYRVVKVNFGKDGQPIQSLTSTTAAIPVMENPNLNVCPGSCFRPVGLLFDAKRRLYVSSDSTGEIYVIYGA